MKCHEKIFTKHFEFVVKIFLEYLSEYRIGGLKIKEQSLINDIVQFWPLSFSFHISWNYSHLQFFL